MPQVSTKCVDTKSTQTFVPSELEIRANFCHPFIEIYLYLPFLEMFLESMQTIY